jgi:AcrR family transcriptional regulator
MVRSVQNVGTHKSTAIRQKQIMLAARKLIVKYGSEHLTVRRMASEIGVTEAAIYRHFKSKADILSLLADVIKGSLLSGMQQKHTNGESALTILEEAMDYHVSNLKLRKGTEFLVIAEIISFGDKKLNSKIYKSLNEYIAAIKDLLSRGMEEGVIKEDIDLESTALLFFVTIQGLANIWTLSRHTFTLEKTYRSIWDILHTSIAKN